MSGAGEALSDVTIKGLGVAWHGQMLQSSEWREGVDGVIAATVARHPPLKQLCEGGISLRFLRFIPSGMHNVRYMSLYHTINKWLHYTVSLM